MGNNQLMNLGMETEQIEYKKSTGELKEGVISIASILNKHESGVLYFGVKSDGTVIGQEISEDSLRKVSQAIRNHITPVIYPEIEVVEFSERKTIVVKFNGTMRPYLAYNIPRIRVSDEDIVMAQDMYDEMIRKRSDAKNSWERRVSKYKINDIDNEVFEDYLRRAKEAGRIAFNEDNPHIVLDKLELVEGDFLLNAGAALFCDTGMNELQMAKFATNERLTFTDIRRFTGSILSLIKKAEQYVIDAMDWRVEIGGELSRKEIPEIPLDAIREAIINSFGHKLMESGESNEVVIFKNRIEIYNPGSFPEGLSPKIFIDGQSRPIRRNPLIAKTLYYSKDMESFATGLRRIKNACDESGCKVEFDKQLYGFAVIFQRKQESEPVVEENMDINLKPQSEALNGALNEALNNTLEKDDSLLHITNIINEKPNITQREIAEILGLSRTTVQRGIKKLMDEERLIRVGSKKKGYWKLNS